MSHQPSGMRLYSARNERLYLNSHELQRFVAAAERMPTPIRRFCLTLAYTGVRISEARYLRGEDLQFDARILSERSLKKRDKSEVREVPMPQALVSEFCFELREPDHWLWPVGMGPVPRITAYRWVKDVMRRAEISGPKACPKGLRHGYAARATMTGVPAHMLQKWMGHASMKTTAIYATLLGPDQLFVSDWMWDGFE
ncbi:tyrosine-type recombinase/integrase [Tateyamaria sp. SN3-11]|uniref:tyrosine-type recombinase/integrase n=1 Tax=Tateyamaria sp. SN3-11 TaxID=3092147 RepID=UPI0039ECEAB8